MKIRLDDYSVAFIQTDLIMSNNDGELFPRYDVPSPVIYIHQNIYIYMSKYIYVYIDNINKYKINFQTCKI